MSIEMHLQYKNIWDKLSPIRVSDEYGADMWLAILFVVVVFWLLMRQRGSAASRNSTFSTTDIPISITVSTSSNHSDIKVQWESTGSGVRIGTNLPLPVTLSCITDLHARRIAESLESYDTYTLRGWLTTVIASNNVHCKEIDEWVTSAKPKFKAAVKQAIAASAEWSSASERDRDDLLTGFEDQAAESLAVRPASIEAALALLTEEPADVTVDDALLGRFANNMERYPVLLGALTYGPKVQVVPVGSYNRKEYEALADMGYLRRGADIDIDDILMALTLKQMNEIAGTDTPKKLTRKAPAAEFLKTLPDLRERLGKVVAFREMFQVAPIPDIDVGAIVVSYSHAQHMAQVIVDTLKSGLSLLRSIEGSQGCLIEGWVLSSGDCCPDCRKLDGKIWKRQPEKLPPLHIGCSAELNWS